MLIVSNNHTEKKGPTNLCLWRLGNSLSLRGRVVNGRGKRWTPEGDGKILFLGLSAGTMAVPTLHKHVPLLYMLYMLLYEYYPSRKSLK